MRRFIAVFALCITTLFNTIHADTVIWTGAVNSDGSKSARIKLIPGQLYQINAKGTVVLGKWSRNGQSLINDAGYEFNAVGTPVVYPVLKNNLDLPLGNGTYHPDHAYQSAVFNATKDELYFWVFSTDYSDNTGAFAVEVVHVEASSAKPTVIWKGPVRSDGPPTPKVRLTVGQTYQIDVTGSIILGRQEKSGKQMINDACYEYNSMGVPILLPTFKNTLNISVCDGKYHANHAYQSQPFVAEAEDISFWIFDTDYRDNSGELQVTVSQVGKVLPAPAPDAKTPFSPVQSLTTPPPSQLPSNKK